MFHALVIVGFCLPESFVYNALGWRQFICFSEDERGFNKVPSKIYTYLYLCGVFVNVFGCLCGEKTIRTDLRILLQIANYNGMLILARLHETVVSGELNYWTLRL